MTQPAMCLCEHDDHGPDRPGHAYADVPAGDRQARYVGPLCDPCADGHMADFVITPAPVLDLPELLRPPSAYRTVIEREFASTRAVHKPADLPAMSVSTKDAVYLLADLTSVKSHEMAAVVIEVEGESLTVPPRAVSWLADTLRALVQQIHLESAREERRRVFAAAAGGAGQ